MNAAAAPDAGGPALARALFGHALAAFRAMPPEARAPSLAALDRFLAAPGPARFLAATRVLRAERRRCLVATTAGATMERGLADGLAAVRAVPGLPADLVERLAADLEPDPRAGQRLHALAALAQAYEELGARVAADTDEMRRRLRESGHRRSSTRRSG
jgi:hypothetical protein